MATVAMSRLTQTLGSKLTEVSFQKFELSVAPTQEQRRALQARRLELEKALDKPATKLERDEFVTKMIAAFRLDLPDEDAEGFALNYIEALEGMPVWAVEKGFKIVMRGADGRANLNYIPTPPEFTATVAKLVNPLRAERLTIHRILEADVYTEPTEEERARVKERLSKMVAGMAARAEADERAEKEAEFRKREAIEEAARQAAASAAARQSGVSPSSQQAERSSSPETHSASE